MYNNNLNNTLHEDVNVLIKEFLPDINNSSTSEEEVTPKGFFPSCGICFSFQQLILAYQNLACVRNPHCGRHCITAVTHLYLCQRSAQGRRRLYTLILSLLRQRQRFQEIRTSPFSQPLLTRTSGSDAVATRVHSGDAADGSSLCIAPLHYLCDNSKLSNCTVPHTQK